MSIPVTAVILAADADPAQASVSLKNFRGSTLLRRTVEATLRSQADRVVVVLGSNAALARNELAGLDLTVTECRPGERNSLQAGLRAVPPESRGALVLECDQPFVSGEILDALLLRHNAETESVVASLSGGKRTLPAIVPRSCFDEWTASRSGEDVGALLASARGVQTIPFLEGEERCPREGDPGELGPISTIIFDFGMVISSFEVAQFLRNLVPYTGKSMTELKDLLGVVRDIVIEYETGLMSTDDFVTRVFTATNLPLTREQFRLAYTDIFTPITSTHDLIRRLKPHYRLGLLSNTSEWHFEHAIRTTPVFPLFDAVTLSYEVKALKPARNIYDDMLAKLRARPHECVYIDDIAANTSAAAWLGMQAIQYHDHEQLVSELRRIGISV